MRTRRRAVREGEEGRKVERTARAEAACADLGIIPAIAIDIDPDRVGQRQGRQRGS